ncbi:MAG: hypothetical protein OQK32_01640 [Gammaproteobacteria bacterium]|nr:hypothetical protein [Gammaproteobacteria bacterium]MCW8923165.1 hypothetical protein [Gammaproteobacteria bacterium]
MRFNYSKLIYGVFCSTLLIAGCGGDSSSPSGVTAVEVNFSVDDSANMVYQAGDLMWKGSFAYDSATRILTPDLTWSSPNIPLYDDGPYTAGGHEPVGATANDHIWGISVLVVPATSTLTFEYGLVDSSMGNVWIWEGSNGTFSVEPTDTMTITATGQTFPLFGTTDMRLEIDTSALSANFTPWDPANTVKIMGSNWNWDLVTLVDDGTVGDTQAGDGIYTFELSQYVGAGNAYPHLGLLNSGDIPEFLYMLAGIEYKDFTTLADSTGVTASVKAAGAGSWTTALIANSVQSSSIIVP